MKRELNYIVRRLASPSHTLNTDICMHEHAYMGPQFCFIEDRKSPEVKFSYLIVSKTGVIWKEDKTGKRALNYHHTIFFLQLFT